MSTMPSTFFAAIATIAAMASSEILIFPKWFSVPLFHPVTFPSVQ